MGSWIVGAIVLVLIGLAVRMIYMNRKMGKGCGYGCEGCPSRSGCAGGPDPSHPRTGD